MGFLEQIIGNFLIPSILFVLGVLANGTGRRLMNKFILWQDSLEVGANGYHFKLNYLILLTNLACIFVGLSKVYRLQSIHEKVSDDHHVDHVYVTSYQTELNLNYRNILMHICSVTLILCLNVATDQYERYKPIKELGEKIDKDRQAAAAGSQ